MSKQMGVAEQIADTKSGKEGKYLTFSLSNEEYGLEILKIKEIIGMMDITSVPKTPEFVKGVINLRGKVIPVIDLRLKFGMSAKEYDARTCIIVVEVADMKDRSLQVGIVVDSVSEVVNLKGEQIEPPPSFGAALDTEYILGMAKIDKSVVILLEIDRVLAASETETLMKMA